MGNVMKYNKFQKDFSLYQDDSENVSSDMEKITYLKKNKKNIDKKMAAEIYYQIKVENITFDSSIGIDFLDEIAGKLTSNQIKSLCKKAAVTKSRMSQERKALKANKAMAFLAFAAVFAVCFCYLNWNLFLDCKTNLDTWKLRQVVTSAQKDQRNVSEEENAEREASLAQLVSAQTKETQVQKADISTSSETVTKYHEDIHPELIMEKYQSLYAQNPDFRGWISIEGTKINYPMMQMADENDYYLYHNFDKKEDKNGLLVMDYRSDITNRQKNMIIYGHNMSTGVMFGTLKNYKEKEYCDKHPYIKVDTLYEEKTYEIVAAFLSEVAYADEDVYRYYDAINMGTEQEFVELWTYVLSHSIYTTQAGLEYGDSCLILSTCDHYTEDGRFVVIAKER